VRLSLLSVIVDRQKSTSDLIGLFLMSRMPRNFIIAVKFSFKSSGLLVIRVAGVRSVTLLLKNKALLRMKDIRAV